ncbi:MAG: prolipoprotein diacylglyceryl transferase [Vicinamibacteraceae bacterium]
MLRIGSFEVTSFGAMVALGALVGVWLLRREGRRVGLPETIVDVGIAGVIGGLLGAKLLWTAEHLGDEPLLHLLTSRGGMSWFGGFAGGLAAGIVFLRRARLSTVAVLAAATPGLAAGHAIGRIGCLLVGDDYGRPSTLPWAVAFPQGLPPTDVPVHPTQIYEAIPLFALAILLTRLRAAGASDRAVFGAYLLSAGALRFAIEFLRVNERVLLGLSVAHLASLAAMLVGAALLARRTPATMQKGGGTAERRPLSS